MSKARVYVAEYEAPIGAQEYVDSGTLVLKLTPGGIDSHVGPGPPPAPEEPSNLPVGAGGSSRTRGRISVMPYTRKIVDTTPVFRSEVLIRKRTVRR